MAFQKRALLFAGLLAGLAIVAGCRGAGGSEEPAFAVRGKVTKDDKPLPLDPKLAAAKAARVELRFFRLDGKEANLSQTAFAEPDGAFEVPGGLPAGKYRISVKHFDGGSDDELKGKFGEKNSPIEREISGETEIEIDLAEEAK